MYRNFSKNGTVPESKRLSRRFAFSISAYLNFLIFSADRLAEIIDIYF